VQDKLVAISLAPVLNPRADHAAAGAEHYVVTMQTQGLSMLLLSLLLQVSLLLDSLAAFLHSLITLFPLSFWRTAVRRWFIVLYQHDRHV
jgi:hypothetical protein